MNDTNGHFEIDLPVDIPGKSRRNFFIGLGIVLGFSFLLCFVIFDNTALPNQKFVESRFNDGFAVVCNDNFIKRVCVVDTSKVLIQLSPSGHFAYAESVESGNNCFSIYRMKLNQKYDFNITYYCGEDAVLGAISTWKSVFWEDQGDYRFDYLVSGI